MRKQKSPSEHLYNFFYTLFKRKYLLILIFMATFAGILSGTYLIDPMWKATAKIRVQFNPKNQLTMLEGITTPGAVVAGVNPANDVIQMLMSREIAEAVIKKFERDKLWQKKVNSPEKTREIIRWHIKDIFINKPMDLLRFLGILSGQPDNYLAMAVDEFKKDLLDIELEEDTTVVNVSVWGESPDIATSMSNTLVTFLLKKNLDFNKSPIRDIISTTMQQMREAEKELSHAQESLRKFKEESGLVLYDEEASILLQRLDKYETELSSMENQMISLTMEKSSEHPDVRSLSARISEYKNIIIPKVRSALLKLPLKEAELSKISQELKVREDLYSALKQKVLELEVLKNSSTGDLEIKVVDPAKVYSYVKPDWPRWIINIPLGFIGSILTGVLFIFFVEYWNSSFKSVKELEENFNIPVLGAVPQAGFFSRKEIDAIRMKNIAPVIPSPSVIKNSNAALSHCDTLADSILIKKRTNNCKRYLITSPGQGEGKSTVISLIGQLLAIRSVKVLLVEANLRNPSLEKLFNVKAVKGLIDYYHGDATQSEIIYNVDGIDVIFTGNLSANQSPPFEIYNSNRINMLLNEARERYDFIFTDSPCIKKYNDALSLTSFTDGVILVVEANRTPERLIHMSQEKIKAVGSNIRGIILNRQINYVPDMVQNIITLL